MFLIENKKKLMNITPNINIEPQNTKKKDLLIYIQIVRYFKVLIICSFSLFLCLFLLVLIVIYVNIGLLYSVIQYSIINTKIDNYSYGALNAFQVSLLTNVFSNEISKIIYIQILTIYLQGYLIILLQLMNFFNL